MKRKLVISVLLIILLIAVSTNVKASTNSSLANDMYEKLSNYGLTKADQIKVERYLKDNPITDSQADEIMGKVDEAIAIMDSQGVKDYKKLTNQGKNQIKTIATEAGKIAGVSVVFKVGTVEIYSSQGNKVETIHDNVYQFVQTGGGVEDILEQIKENETVEVNEIEIEEISKTAFEKLKNVPNAKLKVNAGNAIWVFESGKITNSNIIFNPKVQISNEKFDNIKNNNISKGIFVDFNHNGKLPGAANVTLNVGTEKYGEGNKTLYLYYYNPETEAYEYIGEASYKNGEVSMVLEHCSTYVLVEEKIAKAEENKDEEKATNNQERKLDNEPKTGKNTIALGFMFIISTIGMIVCKIK